MRLLLLVPIILVQTFICAQSTNDTIRLSPSVIVYESTVGYDSIAQSSTAGVGYFIPYKLIKDQNTSSIDDLLRLIPSVNVRNYGGLGGLKTISVRGLGAQHSGLLLNGNLISDQKSGQK